MSYAEVADQITTAGSTFLNSIVASSRQQAAHLAALAGVALLAARPLVRRMTPLGCWPPPATSACWLTAHCIRRRSRSLLQPRCCPSTCGARWRSRD